MLTLGERVGTPWPTSAAAERVGTPWPTSAAAPLYQPAISNCTDPATRGWKAANGKLMNAAGLCATALQPVSNGGSVVMAKCGSDVGLQEWTVNSTFFADKIPNASTAVVLPKHIDSPETFGFTFGAKGDGTGPQGQAAIVLYDIGSRFHGECTGHYNCDFNFDEKSGQLSTFWGEFCVAALAVPPAPRRPRRRHRLEASTSARRAARTWSCSRRPRARR